MEEYRPESQEPSGSQAVRQLSQRVKDGTLKDILRDWKWILSLCRGHWWSIALYTLCGIGASAIALASGVASKYLIDCIVSLDRQRLFPLAAVMVATAAISVAFRSFTSRFSARLNISMHNTIREKVFTDLLNSKWMEIRKFSTGDLLSRFGGDLNTVAGCAVSWLPSVIIQTFTVLATLGVVLYYDPMMALIAFASTPALLFASRRLMRRQRTYNKRMRQVSAGMSSFQTETFRNIDTLKSFGVEAAISRKLRSWQEKYRETTLAYNLFSIRTNIFLTAMGTAVQYAALGYCLWRLFRGDILFGTMTLFLQQRSNLSNAFSSLVSQVPTIVTGSVAATRIRELAELPKEDRSEQAQPQGSCALEMTDVRAAYTPDRRVLENVNILAPAGEVIALIGPSGEGKSTLMRLMLGLITPDTGSLTLTDEAGRVYPLGPETRSCFAYVPQGNTVLAGTVAENLRLVNDRATEEEMIAALQDACAWEFVSRMPQGLHSYIGEGGKGLSEGQAQRISIARALLRRAPIMLLDEVTSALDYETEQKVLQNLMHRGVTCVVATHRPSVLGLCSRIYQVQEGRVTPLSGDQRQLLEQEIKK